MFTRKLTIGNDSIILFGPRGTGKSTWIKQQFPTVPIYDLLDTKEFLRLSKEPYLINQELKHLPENSLIVIDEVQKVPALLDEVHKLMEDQRLRFILSGSSARKIKRGGANLLAGRAKLANMFPLVSSEVNFQFDIQRVLQFGTLPMSFVSSDPVPYLKTYAEIYLEEEIKGEAITRNIGHFGRFLEIAARQNGQVTNVSNISRDAMVARQTVQGYFDILKDTLIGYWLYSWKLKRATKQVLHPKFYFFDPGVVRALSGRIAYPPSHEEAGHLFETFILNEIRAYLSYLHIDYPIYFWASHGGVEVDLFCETNRGFIAIEIKSSQRWDNSFNKGLNRLIGELGESKVRCFGIYMGEREMRSDHIVILPVLEFLKKLWTGEIIS
jgi:predicted AAA+ superfamily ATPase